jgi:hypothetical protein
MTKKKMKEILAMADKAGVMVDSVEVSSRHIKAWCTGKSKKGLVIISSSSVSREKFENVVRDMRRLNVEI